MSQQPPPPPYGDPPGPPYGAAPGPYPQDQPRSGISNKAKFWIGVALTIPAIIVSGLITGAAAAIVEALNGDPAVEATVSSVVALLVLVGYVAMIVLPRTRWIALGILAGTAVLFILAAGACVALLVTYSGGS